MVGNILFDTDGYKPSHHPMYPPGMTRMNSYFESRGGAWDEVVFFGMQYFIKEYLVGMLITRREVHEAEVFYRGYYGRDDVFNKSPWLHIIDKHGGCLPLRIMAVPEGTVVPVHNVLATVENTCDDCAWLTNYIETLLVQVWYPCTIATQSRQMKKILVKYALLTGAPLDVIAYQLHDFGFRGSTSLESSAIGGAAHLVNFRGSDTISAIRLLQDYYDEPMAATSIPAAEHSTITGWGREHEVDAYRNILQKYPTGMVAVVSDSYDIINACRNLWGKELRDQVLGRDGKLVIRPDSGDPPTMVVKVLDTLFESLGYYPNPKGFKNLNPKVGVIQGDGIDIIMLEKILQSMLEAKWSTANIAFGSGGGLLQKVNRDTLKFAFKACWMLVNGVGRDVYKDPVTDPGKVSKRGRLALVNRDGVYMTIPEHLAEPGENCLKTIFEDGEIVDFSTFSQVRQRAELPELLAA